MKRQSGILLHITSLPNKYGVGTLGKEAYEFVDYLKEANVKIWQVLPTVPTSYGDSPYQSFCATAVNPYMIDLDELRKRGLLKLSEYRNVDFGQNEPKVNYEKLFNERFKILRIAFSRFNRNNASYKKFLKEKEYYNYALFMSLKYHFNQKSWNEWPEEYRNRDELALAAYAKENKKDIEFFEFTQYMFLRQWKKLKRYANKNGIQIMGDMPLYVAYDSIETWTRPEMFQLDENKNIKFQAAVPPDCFTEWGQLWGNPIYDWEFMKNENYAWWNYRIENAFSMFDIVRIDHFRGFDRFYQVEKQYNDAKIGEWKDGPKFDLFKDKTHLKIVAEDLGFIDEGVHILMRQTGYPGMKIMEFAFDGSPDNEHKPSNYTENFVVYSGTHDNMPLRQYIDDLNEWERNRFVEDLRKECEPYKIKVKETDSVSLTKKVIELGYASKANTAIFPMQDLLAQGVESRMNLPATVSTDNWSYKISKKDLSKRLQNRIKKFNKLYNR